MPFFCVTRYWIGSRICFNSSSEGLDELEELLEELEELESEDSFLDFFIRENLKLKGQVKELNSSYVSVFFGIDTSF